MQIELPDYARGRDYEAFQAWQRQIADFIQDMGMCNNEFDLVQGKAVFSGRARKLLASISEYCQSTPLWKQSREMESTKAFIAAGREPGAIFRLFMEKVEDRSLPPDSPHRNVAAITLLPLIEEALRKPQKEAAEDGEEA